MNVIVVLDFRELKAFIMPELASSSVRAEGSFMKLLALLAFVLIVDGIILHHNFLCTMCELAFVPVSAKALLNPILAHLCFKLGLINL